MKDIINGLYVELDCLMDTRLSLLYDIDKNLIESIIKSGKYSNRIMDQFGYLSVRVFRTIYNMRNSNILDNPAPTEITSIISDYCFEAMQTSKKLGDGSPIKIYLNVHPYNLTEASIERLRMGLSNAIDVAVDIAIINKPFYDITPNFINENIGLVIMYDALKWTEFNLQNKRLIEKSLPDVTFLTPMLLHRKLIIKKSEVSKLFEDLEKNLQMLIGIVFIPVKYFSIKEKSIYKL